MNESDRRLLLTGGGVGLAWIVSRLAMAYLWFTRCQFIAADVQYYFAQIHNQGGAALAEYPTPILWTMRLLDALAGHDLRAFIDLFVALIIFLDAAVTVALFWRGSPLAAAYWVAFMAILGPIIWFRVDMIPAALVTLALLWLTRRPAIAGALLAAAAATKLWPALLILPTLGRDRSARRRLAGFLIAGAALGGLSLSIDGWARSVSPIAWQLQRGLQVESLAATRAMVLHATRPTSVTVFMSRFHAYELTGVGVEGGLRLATALTGLAFLLVLALSVVLARRRQYSPRAALLAVAAVTVAVIASNKTFSPQYVMWLAGPLGLVLASARTRSERRVGAITAFAGCAVAALTQLIFPLNYGELLAIPGDPGVTTLLVVRNALVAALAVGLGWSALRAAWRAPTSVDELFDGLG